MNDEKTVEAFEGSRWLKSGRLNPVAIQVILLDKTGHHTSYDQAKQLRLHAEATKQMRYSKSDMIEMTGDQTFYPIGWYPIPEIHEQIDTEYNRLWVEAGGKNQVNGLKHIRNSLKGFFDPEESDPENTEKRMRKMKDTKEEIYLMLHAMSPPAPLKQGVFDDLENVRADELVPVLPHILRMDMEALLELRKKTVEEE